MALAAAGDAARGRDRGLHARALLPPRAHAAVRRRAGRGRGRARGGGAARPAGARPGPGRGGAARGGDRGRRRGGGRRRRLRRADRPVPRPRRDRAARGDPQARDEPGRQDRDGDGGEPLDLRARRRGRLVHRWRADADAVGVGHRHRAGRRPAAHRARRRGPRAPAGPRRVRLPGDAAAPLRAGPHRAGAAGHRAGRRGRAGRRAWWPWRRWASRWCRVPGTPEERIVPALRRTGSAGHPVAVRRGRRRPGGRRCCRRARWTASPGSSRRS